MCQHKNHDPMTSHLDYVVDLSIRHVKSGGIPFTAIVVDSHGVVVGEGVNRVREHSDPTAHAEVEAIRDATRRLKTPHLQGMTLIASGEPCAMCYMNTLFAGIGEVIFVADRHEAAAGGFDYTSSYTLFNHDPLSWHSPRVRKAPIENGLTPFLLFKERFQ
jgi:guanine deaminase